MRQAARNGPTETPTSKLTVIDTGAEIYCISVGNVHTTRMSSSEIADSQNHTC